VGREKRKGGKGEKRGGGKKVVEKGEGERKREVQIQKSSVTLCAFQGVCKDREVHGNFSQESHKVRPQ